MTLIPSPDFNFSSYTLQMLRQSLAMKSPFSGKSQVLAMPYALWHFKGQFSIQDTYKAGLLRAFFTNLDGQANTFRLSLPGFTAPLSGYAGFTGYVNGANQTGTSLITIAWSASTLILQEGDYFTVNDELKVVTAPCYSDGSGNATINFKPALRTSPATGLQLFIGNAVNLLPSNIDLSNTVYWGRSNCTVAQSGTDPFSGTASYQISQNPANTNSYIVSTNNTTIKLQGKTITGSCYLKTGTYTGTVALTLKDSLGVAFGSATATPTSSYARYSVTATMPTYGADGIQLYIDPTNDTSIPLNATWFASYPQVEIGSSASSMKTIWTGDGNPYILAQCIDDNQASWDMSPPIISQFNLEAIEAVR